MVVSSGDWSAGFSQFTSVCWWCSIRRTRARGPCKRAFIRAAACENRTASDSTPFIKITRTRVNASSSSLLNVGPASSRQVKTCRSSGTPRSFVISSAMGDLQVRQGNDAGASNNREPLIGGRFPRNYENARGFVFSRNGPGGFTDVLPLPTDDLARILTPHGGHDHEDSIWMGLLAG